MSDNVDTTHDLVIVGGGPAGLTAAIYARRALLDTVLLERESYGGQAVLTTDIDNYPGVPHTDGFLLGDAMRAQADELGTTMLSDAVTSIARDDGGVATTTLSGSVLRSRSVVFSGGAQPRRAGFEGEEAFTGRGVSYCVTCDAMFYRGKDVFVVGGGNSAAEESLFLARIARSVTVLVRKDHLRAQASVVHQLEEADNVTLLLRTSVVRVDGDQLVGSITLRDNATGEERTIERDEGSFGVFVLVGRVPDSQLVEGLCELDPQGYVIADDHMATSTPGLFVAGDVRRKYLRQVVTAASDGAVAATAAAAFLGQPVEG